MCVIMYKKIDEKNFLDSDIKNAMLTNSDGFSLTVLNGQNQVVKMIKTLDSQAFWRFYNFYKEKSDYYSFIFHFRIATNGAIVEKNCHPFQNDNYILWHNGVISEFSANKNIVDSKQFLNKYFKKNMNKKQIEKIINHNKVKGNKFIVYNKNTREIILSNNFIDFKEHKVSNDYFDITYNYNWNYNSTDYSLYEDYSREELIDYIIQLENQINDLQYELDVYENFCR